MTSTKSCTYVYVNVYNILIEMVDLLTPYCIELLRLYCGNYSSLRYVYRLYTKILHIEKYVV